jgi:predicted outer membrane repeat protein
MTEFHNRAARRAAMKSARRRVVGGASALGITAAATAAGMFGANPAGAVTNYTVDNLGLIGPGTLSQAISDANGHLGADTITIAATVSGILHTPQLSITEAVTITGPGATTLTLDGSNANRIFYIHPTVSGAPVTISGLKFAHGTPPGGGLTQGGAIHSLNASLTLDADDFAGNKAPDGNGGAVYFQGSTSPLTISNTTFTGNKARYGGAVYVESASSLSVSGSTFTDNDGYLGSGALGIKGAVTATITGSHFATNTADSIAGGAIGSTNTDVMVTDSTFTGNTADENGGAMDVAGPASLTVTGSTFTSNSATYYGGAIDFDGQTVTISSSTFTTNHAGYGGAVFIDSADSDSSVSIDKSTFTGNYVQDSSEGSGGGGVYINGAYNEVNISSTTFSGNHADDSWGGALYVNDTNLYVTTSTFDGNSAFTGGGIAATRSNVGVLDSTLSGNSVDGGGGAIEFDNNVQVYTYQLTVQNTTITGNHADSDGSAIELYGNAVFGSDHATIVGNTGGGAAVNLDAGDVNSGSATPSAKSSAHRASADTKAKDTAETPKPATVKTHSTAKPKVALTLDKPANVFNSVFYNPNSDGELDASASVTPFSTFGVIPGLGALGSNGGPTKTMMPLAGSPLINAGDPDYAGDTLSAKTTDQRGLARVVGVTDIGAVEIQFPIVSDPSSTTVDVGNPASFTVSCTGELSPTVQWQISTDGGTTWANISGATGLTYTIAATTTGQDGSMYRAVCSNSAGAAASRAAALTVVGLASTGADTDLQLPLGAALLAAGGVLVATSRVMRRSTRKA